VDHTIFKKAGQGAINKNPDSLGLSGVDRHLHVRIFPHTQTAIDRRWRGAPIFHAVLNTSARFELLF